MIECKVWTNQVKLHFAPSIILLNSLYFDNEKDHVYISTDVFVYGLILFNFASLSLTINI